ncbi:MAG: hypothetical protein M3280_02380 [Actinomycetota bacterium]|nr:hypothetical protein [Actinomycetota bacterium]
MTTLGAQKTAAVTVAVALIAGVAFWAFSRGGTLGEMMLRAEGGRVTIQRGDETIRVAGETSIEPGDVISAAADAFARLRLEGERELALSGPASLQVLGDTSIESRSGRILAEVGEPLKVMVGQAEARSAGAIFRVDRSYGASRIGVLQGRLTLDAPGEPELVLPTLFQTTVAANRLFDGKPYELNPNDLWDKQHLDALIDLERALDPLAGAFQNQLGQSLPGIDYFGEVAGVDVGFMRRHVARQSPKDHAYTVDLLVALVLAKHAPGHVDENFARAFKLLKRGGSWGVVAGILGLRQEGQWAPMVSGLEKLILGTGAVAAGTGGEADFTLASGELPGADGTGPGSTTGPGPGSGDPGDGGSDPNDPSDPRDPPDPDDPKKRDPKPPPKCEGLVECTADEVLPEPSPTDFLDPPP